MPVPIQNLAVTFYDIKPWYLQHTKTYKKWLTALYNLERQKIEEIKRYRDKHLRAIIQHAYKTIPFYHNLYKKMSIDVSSIRKVEDLNKLPIITKKDILEHSKEFTSTNLKEKFIITHTSGTTGTPTEFRISYSQYLLERVVGYGLRYKWSEYDGNWVARFVGDAPVRDCNQKKLYRLAYLTRRVIFPSYCLSSEILGNIYLGLKKLNIKYIQAYPSTAYLLAKYLEFNDLQYQIKALYYSSEPMYEFQRRVIEERLTTRVFGLYGQAENIISALECEKGNYHLVMIDGVMEITRDGEVLSPGEKGFVVATSLHNTAMPLIRYFLGDYTGYKDDECSCGRNLPLIYPVETRAGEFIVTPEGSVVSPTLLTFPLKYASNIIESQIVQKSIDTIEVRIVKGEKYSENDEDNLLKSLKEILGDQMDIKLRYVDKIYQTKAYKKRFVINELGRDYIEKVFAESKKN